MKVTTKGQVTIPLRIRAHLGLAPQAEVDFQISEGQVVVVKTARKRAAAGRFAALRGVLKGRLTTEQWMAATRGD